jgi:hypothetical protein
LKNLLTLCNIVLSVKKILNDNKSRLQNDVVILTIFFYFQRIKTIRTDSGFQTACFQASKKGTHGRISAGAMVKPFDTKEKRYGPFAPPFR